MASTDIRITAGEADFLADALDCRAELTRLENDDNVAFRATRDEARAAELRVLAAKEMIEQYRWWLAAAGPLARSDADIRDTDRALRRWHTKLPALERLAAEALARHHEAQHGPDQEATAPSGAQQRPGPDDRSCSLPRG